MKPRSRPLELELGVSYALPRAGLPSAVSFRTWGTAVLQDRVKHADLALRLVDEREGCALNRHYRGKDYATNVLSFPAELPEGLPEELHMPLLGDLVICAPEVARDAREQGNHAPHSGTHIPVQAYHGGDGTHHQPHEEELSSRGETL